MVNIVFSHILIRRVLLFQTILVGDSGVGKTSLLVQFDQGKFQTGSFSATVGIGFTVSKVLRVIYFELPHTVYTIRKYCMQSQGG